MLKSDRVILVLLVGSVLLMLLWMMIGIEGGPGINQPRGGFGIEPGETAPPIEAEGWINGPGPTEESLRGKVVVVEAWEYWCVPCLQKAPHLVALYQKFEGEDVVFLGLTTEGESKLSNVKQFVEKAGFPWPNGYGAVNSLIQFGSAFVPSAWVIGRDGKVTWNSGYEHIEPLEEAIAKALAAPPVAGDPRPAGEPAAAAATNGADSAESPAR